MSSLIITGASSGIGRAIANRFLADQWQVINLARRPCPEQGVINFTCDLAQPNVISKITDQIIKKNIIIQEFKPICLVHNAAVMHADRIDHLPTAELRAVLELNIFAVNDLNQLIIPLMSLGSSVIYIGSTLAEKAVPGVASYVIAKHALVGMMRATCQDLAGRGIHTCMICPGFTDTEQLRSWIGERTEIKSAITELSCFNRLIDPAEIASAVACAAQMPILNGAIIHANLGQRER